MREQAPTTTSSAALDGDDLGLGLAGATVAVVAWGSAGVVVKHIAMGGLAIAVYRFAMYSIAIAAWLGVRRHALSLRVLRHSLWGGIALGVDVALFFSAVKLTTIVNATVVSALQPVLVMAVAAAFFGERIRRRDIGLSMLALAGVVVVVGGSTGAPEWNLRGDLAAVGALVAWAGYFIFSKRSRGVLSPSEYTAGTAIITVAINLPLAVAFGQDLSWPSGRNWLWLVVLAFGAGVAGHSVMNWSLQRIPLWLGSTLTLLIPVSASALAWIWLGESLNAAQIVAMLVVLGSLALIVRDQTVARPRPAGPGTTLPRWRQRPGKHRSSSP